MVCQLAVSFEFRQEKTKKFMSSVPKERKDLIDLMMRCADKTFSKTQMKSLRMLREFNTQFGFVPEESKRECTVSRPARSNMGAGFFRLFLCVLCGGVGLFIQFWGCSIGRTLQIVQLNFEGSR